MNDSHQTLSKLRLHHLLGRATAADSYSWSRPVHAPITGTVVRAHDGSPDREHISLLRDLWAMMLSRPTLQPDDISTRHCLLSSLARESSAPKVGLAGFQWPQIGIRTRILSRGYLLQENFNTVGFTSSSNDRYESWISSVWEPALKAICSSLVRPSSTKTFIP